jgi:hypothetical protein
MAKRGLKIFGISAGVLIVVVGIIVGVLFATGVLGKQSTSSTPGPSKHSPLGPDVPNPYEGTTIKTTLSNPEVLWASGRVNLPSSINFKVQYEPNPIGLGVWTLHKTAVLTYKSGATDVKKVSTKGVIASDNISWEGIFSGMFGVSQVPVKVDLSAHLSYTNDHGNEIVGPESNTLTVNIPTNY